MTFPSPARLATVRAAATTAVVALSTCFNTSLRSADPAGPPPLKVSENRRFLVKSDGTPFFYLGDTAWELFHRLTREEAEFYLRDRAAKKFTVIQAVVLAEHGGLTQPDPYGHMPLTGNDPDRPDEKYFEHVDWIVNKAASLGLYVGMLPTWGDKVNKKWGMGPEIFTPENAVKYGEWLARRYKDKPIIWILGGDRNPETDQHFAIWRSMAAGIRKGGGSGHLITYHPMGKSKSSKFFHNDAWLDFNMLQSGHSVKDLDNYEMIAADYALSPPKPCIDGEPRYEDHPVRADPEGGWFDAFDARKAAYWALFAGAFGHTYGCHAIWQFWQTGREPITKARTQWREALALPGAREMQHARALIESRPFLTRIPDQRILASPAGSGADHVQSTRDEAGTYLFAYVPSGKPLAIVMSKITGPKVIAHWFNPRTGEATRIGDFTNIGSRDFTPPSSGPGRDWVLVLDDAAKGYPLPGTRERK